MEHRGRVARRHGPQGAGPSPPAGRPDGAAEI